MQTKSFGEANGNPQNARMSTDEFKEFTRGYYAPRLFTFWARPLVHRIIAGRGPVR